nr:hypothetical protein [Tanacetum cinerariifolium]
MRRCSSVDVSREILKSHSVKRLRKHIDLSREDPRPGGPGEAGPQLDMVEWSGTGQGRENRPHVLVGQAQFVDM